jgi:predicted alpha/beta superfamily hydrolase
VLRSAPSAVVVALVACGMPAPGVDAGRDAGRDAASSADATPRDAPPEVDSGEGDAGDPRPLTTIRVHYRGRAGAIAIRGGTPPFSWTASVATVEESPGVHVLRTRELAAPAEWKPMLGDAEWSRGPNYHVAPGDTIDVAPHFVAASGRVVEFDPAFDSAHVGGPRVVWAYLPPGYDENTAARYPVVYMHDGQNLFDPSLAFGGVEWRVDETMDAAAETGACPDRTTCANDGECGGARCDTFHAAIVIAPANGGADRIDEYTPTVDPTYGGGGADAYLRALIEELKPDVDSRLRTRPEREHTAILGSSLGGLVSAYAGVRRADVFGVVGAMSPSTWWDGRVILDEVASIPSRPLRALRVYVDSGDGGASMDGAADTADLATAYETAGYVRGTTLRYVLAPGHQHDETSWAMRLPAALDFVLGPREERP